MHAWCTFALTSAYGSAATSGVDPSAPCSASPLREMRSWRPTSGPREREPTPALTLARDGRRRGELFRERVDRLGEVGARLGEHGWVPPVDGQRHDLIAGQPVRDLD